MNQKLELNSSFPVVIFLHIPKAAGTTLKDILSRQYQREYIYELDNQKPSKSQEDFKNLKIEDKQQIKLLMGHMYFGLHEFMPSPYTYITMLRNPIEKVISYYYFVRKLVRHPDYQLIKSNDISLKEYCTMNRINMCNGQTRFLAGLKNSEGYEDSEILEKAKINLKENFSVVGITEKFDLSLLLMKKKLGWKSNPYYYKRNSNKSRFDEKKRIKEDTIEIIREYNQLDIELYKYANELFNRDLHLNLKSNFQRDLRNFQLLNAVYGKYTTFAQRFINQ